MIRYRIDVADRLAHAYAVTMTLPRPARRQAVELPAWIPGSYLIREFVRHLSRLEATQGGRAVAAHQEAKARWIVECDGEADLVLRWRVHALDSSVRAAWLDGTRGFFNATSLLLRAEGRTGEPHAIELAGLPDDWDVATTLPVEVRDAAVAMSPSPTTPASRAATGQPAPATSRALRFVAADYDTLADHPVELGAFWRGSFEAGGVPHEFVVAGAWPDFDGAKLVEDARAICATVIDFWRGAPFDRYLFLLNALDDGRGGLEHRDSTALVAARRDLPRRDAPAVAPGAQGEGPIDLLGLVAHEYFHAWSVKRLKPREFAAYDYAQETYSRLLWFFEGFTSYYDDLLVRRAGRLDDTGYLKLVAKAMTTVAATPGRAVQSVAAASFDAWIKLYRPDENSPNATVSYYVKGSLVGLAFDLTLRGEGRGSLDDVMRRLWQASGGGPVDEADIAAAFEEVGGRSFAPEIAAWVHGTEELPLAALLQRMGVVADRAAASFAQRLGVRVSESALTGVRISHVLAGSAAERAGFSPGDELVGVGDWRVRRLDDAQRLLRPAGAATTFLVARDQRLLPIDVDAATLASDVGAWQLRVDASAGDEAKARLAAWMRG